MFQFLLDTSNSSYQLKTINPLSTKPYIIITIHKVSSFSAVSETFLSSRANCFFSFFWQKSDYFLRTMEISQKVSKMWNIVRNVGQKTEILAFLLRLYKRLVALFARERGWRYKCLVELKRVDI